MAKIWRNQEARYVHPFRIFGNVWYVGDDWVCVHLIDTGDGLLLIDSGNMGATAMLVNAIWEAGFNPADVKWIVLSHGHLDHIGGAGYFRNMYGDVALSESGLEQFGRVLLGYPSIFVVGQTVGIFSLLCGVPAKQEKSGGLLLAMDKCSFGIYLIHMIFVMIVMKVLLVNPYEYGGALLFAAMTGAFFALSFAVTFVLRKVPGLNRVL